MPIFELTGILVGFRDNSDYALFLTNREVPSCQDIVRKMEPFVDSSFMISIESYRDCAFHHVDTFSSYIICKYVLWSLFILYVI